MKALLVVRGSQGDIFPYLMVAKKLERRGHTVTISVPQLFEEEAKREGVHYTVQAPDDIASLVGDKPDTKDLLAWMRRVIVDQFSELIPLVQEHDILVAANTEFAASSIAEYCKKPFIRTCFAPLLPGTAIAPPFPVMANPRSVLPPRAWWGFLNLGGNFMAKKPVNQGRAALGMPLLRSITEHMPSHADNFLMYSPTLGQVDQGWKWRWHIGGYCFNDDFPYNEEIYQSFLDFIRKDKRKTLFFTMGSCNDKHRDRMVDFLAEICIAHDYKLVIGCGWWDVGAHLAKNENLFLLDKAVPHCLILPRCDAIIHHGGSGTTHSAARSGKPQMVVPLILDQFYWSYRVEALKIGPAGFKLSSISKQALEKKTLDLMNNPMYKENARVVGEKIQGENGIEALCDYIERVHTTSSNTQ